MRQPIIDAIALMDLQELENLLEDDVYYASVPKKLFLHEMAKMFDTMRSFGNSYLIPNIGICQNFKNECMGNADGGYAFVGNISGHHFDCMMSKNFLGPYNIFGCSNFKSLEAELNGPYIEFKISENIFENPALKHIADEVLDKTQSAIHQLIGEGNEDVCYSLHDLGRWRLEHYELYYFTFFVNWVDDPLILYFRKILHCIERLEDYTKKAKNRLNEINHVLYDQVQLTQWLLENESFIISLIVSNDVNLDYYKNPDYIKPDPEIPIILLRNKFDNLIVLHALLTDIYFKKLHEVKTISDEEFQREIDKYGDGSEVYCLSYFLKGKEDL